MDKIILKEKYPREVRLEPALASKRSYGPLAIHKWNGNQKEIIESILEKMKKKSIFK